MRTFCASSLQTPTIAREPIKIAIPEKSDKHAGAAAPYPYIGRLWVPLKKGLTTDKYVVTNTTTWAIAL
jgi:hypothetical protein